MTFPTRILNGVILYDLSLSFIFKPLESVQDCPILRTSSPSGGGSTTTVTTLSGLCGQPRLQFTPSAYLFLWWCHQPLSMRMTNPPHSSFRGTPASSSARLFITVVGQSLEIRVPLGSRHPFQVRHYHNDHQRCSQGKHQLSSMSTCLVPWIPPHLYCPTLSFIKW